MDLLSVENFLKLTLYLKERLGLFYWIICFPRSPLVYVLKSMVFTADHNPNRLYTQLSKTISQVNKVQRDQTVLSLRLIQSSQAAILGSP